VHAAAEAKTAWIAARRLIMVTPFLLPSVQQAACQLFLCRYATGGARRTERDFRGERNIGRT
jgi:hypothetical protein